MVKRRFQRVSVQQDALIQDYQKRARLVICIYWSVYVLVCESLIKMSLPLFRHLEKSLKDHKAEDVKCDDLLK